MKTVLAFDSFKGSLSAEAVCAAVASGIRSVRPEWETVCVPMADGGEGTARAMMSALGGEWVDCRVTGPLFSMKVDAGFAWFPERKLAVIEMAQASGLPLLRPEQRNPMRTTTYGTGELIRMALRKGAREILLTVGGSATVDGGTGAAAALGWRFPDAGGNPLEPVGASLSQIEKIIPPSGWNVSAFPAVEVLCDVVNPLCGPDGAAQVYGPQKGATLEMVEELDAGLFHLSEKIKNGLGKEVREVPGAGAAGGLSAGAIAFMNGRLVSGVGAVMETVGLAERLDGADWVLTGEGRFDSQSLRGKVVDGVARLARDADIRVGVIAGCVTLTEEQWRAAGIEYVAALQRPGMSTEESVSRCRELLERAGREYAATAGKE